MASIVFPPGIPVPQLPGTTLSLEEVFDRLGFLQQRITILDDQGHAEGCITLQKLLLMANGNLDRPLNLLDPQLLEPLPAHQAHESPATGLSAQQAELLAINRLKDEFLACVSHELRTPLTAILGLATLLQEKSVGALNERQQRYAQLIHRSGRHLMAIVNDILDLTRLESGQVTLSCRAIDIATIAREAFEQAQKLEGIQRDALLEARAFTLILEPGLTTLVADGDRLRQMLSHLLSNALKFTPEAAGRIGLNVSRWEGWVAFTVWDTGIGIPPNKQHLLFQKFQQLENPMTRQFEGAGLGLVLTQRLAHLHGGDVTFTSQENQGSQFTLLLPPEPPPPLRLPQATPLQVATVVRPLAYPRSSNRLVLIVEASPRHLEDGVEQLTALGYRVAIARSGLEALEKARNLQPCIILLNPILPLLSGWDVVKLLKGDGGTASIPIVATVTQGDQIQPDLADTVLRLPLRPQLLADTLNHWVKSPAASTQSTRIGRSVVLCLSPPPGVNGILDVPHLLSGEHHRIIEAHDLDQAELLAQVWHPHVVVLNCPIPEARTYLDHWNEHSCLAALPLITLDVQTTQIANQLPGLAVFPCLGQEDALQEGTLAAAIAIAMNFSGRPLILAVDLSQFDSAGPSNHWLSALTQYLQAAHLRVSLARSLHDLQQTLQTQTVHLLLVYWQGPAQALEQCLQVLQQMPIQPPVILLNHEVPGHPALPTTLDSQIRVVTAAESTESMASLLEMIHQDLGGS
jgi:signal transduction histidine kinase/DNA-binding response OmpR family regulator